MTVAIPLGRVGFVPRRDYSPGQECFPLDAVNYRNTLWACLAQTTDLPSESSPNWMAMLSLAAGLAPGGGLDVNEDGLIFVAPEGFSENLLEQLMARMRVSIWLEQNTTWYLSGLSGSDDNDGLSRDKPFKTFAGAFDRVAGNFNFGVYTGTIRVLDGEFSETVNLPKYNSTNGTFKLLFDSAVKLKCLLQAKQPGSYVIDGAKLVYNQDLDNGQGYYRPVYAANGAAMQVYRTSIDMSANSSSLSSLATPFSAGSAGEISIRDGCSAAGYAASFFHANKGNLVIEAPVTVSGTVGQGTAFATNGGTVVLMPGIPVNGAVTGTRHQAIFNGIIRLNGGSANAFPGTIAGTTDSGGRVA